MTSPLRLTVRFSTSHPDLDLDVPEPHNATPLSLKRILRERLNTQCRLRLIHQGRLLPDTAALSSCITPTSVPDSEDTQRDHDPKGKRKVGEPVHRTYISCGLGDALTPEELEAEARGADKPPVATATSRSTPVPSTRPRPRGFDRFLSQGFTTSEVATLRTQFQSLNHVSRSSPPSPDSLRTMEDAWIDSNASDPANLQVADDHGLSEGHWVAMAMGFFWPLGCVTWAVRQQDIWAERWAAFVVAGAMLGVLTGFIMMLSADTY